MRSGLGTLGTESPSPYRIHSLTIIDSDSNGEFKTSEALCLLIPSSFFVSRYTRKEEKTLEVPGMLYAL